ncbi:MAG: archaellin/type IV pilin N-terminal domain-containing protein [Candidatus Nanoarchaeia archaeon]
MNSKKGVSPLIATVLLLAFAVSIATIIVQLEPFAGGCSAVSTEVLTKDDSPRVCYEKDGPGLEVSLKNGKLDIVGVKASVVGSKDIQNTQADANIPKNSAGKVLIDYSKNNYGSPEKIILTPNYNGSNKMIECEMEEIEIEELNDC